MTQNELIKNASYSNEETSSIILMYLNLNYKIGVGEGTFRLHHFTSDFTPKTRINTASSCPKIRDLMRNK
jgi:hypothetical protein